jgi:hypothetical protein
MDWFPASSSLRFAENKPVRGAIGHFQGSFGGHCDALGVNVEFQFAFPQIDLVEVYQLVGSAPGEVVFTVHLPTGSPHPLSKFY